MEFSFDPSPTLDDVDLMVKAYGEKYGEWPQLIIIDNLMNVSALHDNEWTGMRDIMKACHHIARETDSAIFILHHKILRSRFRKITWSSLLALAC